MNRIAYFIVLFWANSLFAQWMQIGPCGGWITCMKSDPQNPQQMFCGVLQGGAYVSKDRGQNWQLIPDIGEYTPICDLSLTNEGVVYIASRQGLFISRDAGANWEKILNAATWQVFALNESTIVADTANCREWDLEDRHPTNSPWLISYDYGENWQFWQGTVDSNITSSPCLYSHQKRGNMIVTADNEVYRIEGLRIFKTTNENWTEWQHVNDLDSSWLSQYCYAFLFTPDSGTTFYACSEYYDFHPSGFFLGGIFKSEDGWQSWTKVASTNSATTITIKDTLIFIGETDGEPYNTNSRLILYRTDVNSSKQIATFGGDIIAIDAERWDSGELIVATEGGIFKTSDYGENWFSSSNGIHRVNAVAVQVLPLCNGQEKILLAVHKSGIWYSENCGNSWQIEDSSPYVLPGLLKQAPNHAQYLYAGGFEIMGSDSYGSSWDNLIGYFFPAFYYGRHGRVVDIAVDPVSPGHVIVHYFDHSRDHFPGIVCGETFDFGESWTEQHWFGEQYDYEFSWKAVFDSSRLWISHLGDKYKNIAVPAFVVIDSTWEDPNRYITLPDSSLPTFWCVSGDTCYVINTKTATFYRSEDLGETWFVHQFGKLQYNRYYWKDWAVYEPFGQLTFSPDKSTFFFIYPGTGVLVSKDNGESWHTLNENLATLNTFHLSFSLRNPNIAYLATENGFYKMDLISSVNWENDGNKLSRPTTKLRDHIFCYNYPNPFNPSTRITYNLPSAAQVTLMIYNIRGKYIKTLVNEYQTAGLKSVLWDGSDDQGNNVTSGVYLYRLNAGQFSLTNKIILVQ